MKGFSIALLLLSVVAVSVATNAKAVDDILDDVANDSHVDHKAGITEQDVIEAHLDTKDEIGIEDIHREIRKLKKQISRLSKGDEELSQTDKAQLLEKVKVLEGLKEDNENWHDEINDLMLQLGDLKDFKHEDL